jgi:hypothetical protein
MAIGHNGERYLKASTVVVFAAVVMVSGRASPRTEAAGTSCGGAELNCVTEWNRIAEDTVVRSRAFQNEGLIYMAYVSAAVYDAVVALDGRYKPYGAGIAPVPGASSEAAVIEAAYRTLVNYFPAQAAVLDPLHAASLATIPDGPSKLAGLSVGQAAANFVISTRTADGLVVPIRSTCADFGGDPGTRCPRMQPAPGVWRLTPPYDPPQTPWVGNVTPFVLDSGDQFLPDDPPPLQSSEWEAAFDELKSEGRVASLARTPDQTATALFWTANVIRQYNRALRDVVALKSLDLVESARLQAMVNVVGADAQIAVMNAKYHFLFWRPVTAIDPTSVTVDGFGPVPGFDDGNPATIEQPAWRPLVGTPNHPEYPAAHGSITSAMAEVFSTFLGVNQFNLVVHGFNPATGNMDAVRTFRTPADLRKEIIDARVWAGLHYRFSGNAGVVLGRKVAKFDLRVAFQATE